jgi:hypothetical protein
MGHMRMVQFGDTLEIYEYKKDLTLAQQGIRKYARRVNLPLLASDRTDTLSPLEFKKRQDNAIRSRMVFSRIVETNLFRVGRPVLASFTYAENFKDIRGAWEDFRSFIHSLRRKLGSRFSYVAVPEFQKRGAVHFHALFWGLPLGTVEDERSTRLVAGIWQKGFVDLKHTDGNLKIAGYISKYMSKAYLDPRLLRQKAFSCSRNIERPLNQSIGMVWPILEDYQLSTSPPLKSAIYMTKWLGECRKRIYKISS